MISSPQWENWIEDCSVVATYIYLEATNQGLGTCWTQIRQGERNDGRSAEDYIKEMLNLPKDRRILCIMPLGYSQDVKSTHTVEDKKLEELEKVHLEEW